MAAAALHPLTGLCSMDIHINWDNYALAAATSGLSFVMALFFSHRKNKQNLEKTKAEISAASETRSS
jgi:hypothetical protein